MKVHSAGKGVRRLVLDGPHRGDVVYADPKLDVVRLLKWWDGRGHHRGPQTVLYYRVTYVHGTRRKSYAVDAYSIRPLHPDAHLARLQIHAELLLTA